MTQKFTVFALSDATGGLAHNLAVAAVNQFPSHKSRIVRVPMIKKKEEIKEHVLKAQESLGVIVFTFVQSEMRHEILELAKQYHVVAIDIMGPALDTLTNYFHTLPSNEPGLQYKQTGHYFKRVEALEFTVKHDDGLGVETIDAADIIIFGISRTSKTPLSIYLAYQGYLCANVSIIKDVPLPKQFEEIDSAKIVGITTDANKLSIIRSSRLSKLGRSGSELYSDLNHIQEELDYAHKLYRKMNVTIVDTSNKAIEEVASEIILKLKL